MMMTRTVKAVQECERETRNRWRTEKEMEMKVVRVSGNGQQALMTDGGVAHMRALDAIIHLDLISDLDAEAIKTGTWSEQDFGGGSSLIMR
nr:PREDICTED: uncharacterized protein LOC108951719 isoform X2 [Musa acuminata subsp. malaccensis]